MVTTIEMLPVDRLVPHPENPRQDLGDLTELTESIKASGIMQNLTVTPMTAVGPESKGKYWVIIGPRRLAAAKAAGIKEVPCVIRAMDHREQLATMMAENCQRSDLTAYETITGVGRMVQLGMDIPEISQRTGLSAKKVKRDAQIAAAYKPVTLKRANQNGITIQELVELQEIEDPKVRDEVLAKFGQGYAFSQAKSNALYSQKAAHFRDAFMAMLPKGDGIRLHRLSNPNARWSAEWDQVVSYSGLDSLKERPMPQLVPGEEYAWYADGQVGGVYKRNRAEVERKDDARAEEKRRKKMLEAAQALNEQARALREAFVAGLDAGDQGDEYDAMKLLISTLYDKSETDWQWRVNYDHKALRRMLGVEEDAKSMTPQDRKDIGLWLRGKRVPLRRMAAAMAVGFDFWNGQLIRVDRGKFVPAPMSAWAQTYAVLEGLGYKITEFEDSLMRGTHEVYREADE